MELWKKVKDYNNYEISSYGRVKSSSQLLYVGNNDVYHHHLKEKILKFFMSWEYRRIRLYKNSVGKDFSVHRLVAETFIPNPDNKPQVNHKDGNKINNHVENLEWVTRSENNKHAFLYGLNRTVLDNGIKTRFKKGMIPWNKGKKKEIK